MIEFYKFVDPYKFQKYILEMEKPNKCAQLFS